MDNKKRVLLGMSGGVDSSVAAILLKEQGYDVTGVTLHLYDGGCCNLDSVWDAKMICKNLGIEHITLDYEEYFKNTIICNFIEEYKNCRTPNPCVLCNKYLKFGIMYEKAKSFGMDYIATGHYAKIEYSNKYERYVLKKANNILKDQTYFLYYIPKEMLEYVIFPLSEYESKDEIRKIGKENNLRVASKPDSEDICFITNGDYKRFLEKNSDIKSKKGNIVNIKGEKLGEHTGLYKYTIGQRKGLGISNKVPLFVIGFNKNKNELIVGEEDKLYKNEMYVKDINLQAIDYIDKPLEVSVKTRYSLKEEKAKIEMVEDNRIKVKFLNPVLRITPGQSAVFYDNDIVIGGGIIE